MLPFVTLFLIDNVKNKSKMYWKQLFFDLKPIKIIFVYCVKYLCSKNMHCLFIL